MDKEQAELNRIKLMNRLQHLRQQVELADKDVQKKKTDIAEMQHRRERNEQHLMSKTKMYERQQKDVCCRLLPSPPCPHCAAISHSLIPGHAYCLLSG